MLTSHLEKLTGSESFIEKEQFRITPYSPLFIGAGLKLKKGLDYFSRNGITYLFDHNKIYRNFVEESDALEQAIFWADLEGFLRSKNENPTTYVRQKVAGDAKAAELEQPLLDGFGKPIIPGSSLKGSLRTALFSDLFQKSRMSSSTYSKMISSGRKASSRNLEESLLTTYKKEKRGSSPNYDIGRALRISDATFNPSALEIFNVVVVNETRNGFSYKTMGRGSANTHNLQDATFISLLALSFSEEVNPAISTVSIDHKALKAIDWKGSLSFKAIAEACNQLSKHLIELDLDYLKTAVKDLSALDEVINVYDELMEDLDACIEQTKNGKPCWLQRTGWGSGWLTMTGGHAYLTDPADKEYIEQLRRVDNRLFQRTRDMEFPKTRKIVLDLQSQPSMTMGWLLVEQI